MLLSAMGTAKGAIGCFDDILTFELMVLQGTQDWGRFMAAKTEIPLNKGSNSITFMKDQGVYELDYIVVWPLYLQET